MNQQQTFMELLDESFEQYRLQKAIGSTVSTNSLLREKEGFDFDVEAAFARWAEEAQVKYRIIDVEQANRNDVEEIAALWDQPTAYLFTNYGNESAGMYREKIRRFLHDRDLGVDVAKPHVVACIVTECKDHPIADFYERQDFLNVIDF